MRMMGKGGIAIIPASLTKFRNRDVEYFYRQDSDFYYLTGFAEPEAVLVLLPGRPSGEFVLFCRERDPERDHYDKHLVIAPEGDQEQENEEQAGNCHDRVNEALHDEIGPF